MTLQHDPQRILIIRPSALGDVCRTVGVLASLRAAFGGAKIDWLVQDDFAPAIEAHPALNEIISFPRRDFARWWKSPRSMREGWRWLADLRRRHYDLVLDCQGLARSGLMTFATRAPQRVGLRTAREFAALGYNLRAPRDSSKSIPSHTVDQMFLLVEELGIASVRDLRLYAAEQLRQWWRQERERLGIRDQPYAVLAPTSRWPSKRWPIDRFGQLLQPLAQRGFAAALLIGSPHEVDQVEPLLTHHRAAATSGFLLNLVGHTSVAQTMALIAEAGLVIANDSAPLHMAVGFDRPCVGLFGPTDPAVVGPYQRDDAVVRGYRAAPGERINHKNPKLGDSLMRLISTTAVIAAIDRQMARRDVHAQTSEIARSPMLEDLERAKPQAAGAAEAMRET